MDDCVVITRAGGAQTETHWCGDVATALVRFDELRSEGGYQWIKCIGDGGEVLAQWPTPTTHVKLGQLRTLLHDLVEEGGDIPHLAREYALQTLPGSKDPAERLRALLGTEAGLEALAQGVTLDEAHAAGDSDGNEQALVVLKTRAGGRVGLMAGGDTCKVRYSYYGGDEGLAVHNYEPWEHQADAILRGDFEGSDVVWAPNPHLAALEDNARIPGVYTATEGPWQDEPTVIRQARAGHVAAELPEQIPYEASLNCLDCGHPLPRVQASFHRAGFATRALACDACGVATNVWLRMRDGAIEVELTTPNNHEINRFPR